MTLSPRKTRNSANLDSRNLNIPRSHTTEKEYVYLVNVLRNFSPKPNRLENLSNWALRFHRTLTELGHLESFGEPGLSEIFVNLGP